MASDSTGASAGICCAPTSAMELSEVFRGETAALACTFTDCLPPLGLAFAFAPLGLAAALFAEAFAFGAAAALLEAFGAESTTVGATFTASAGSVSRTDSASATSTTWLSGVCKLHSFSARAPCPDGAITIASKVEEQVGISPSITQATSMLSRVWAQASCSTAPVLASASSRASASSTTRSRLPSRRPPSKFFLNFDFVSEDAWNGSSTFGASSTTLVFASSASSKASASSTTRCKLPS
mmetsp:Transcript_36876/g.98219  ORF Transcript_36876/g.98219 Transcript_36876/m.98219 type:complete len:240 (+) Transcript_36876:1277-1996(+)